MKDLKEKLFGLETDDYQNRRGQYPTGGVPDTIDVSEHDNKVFVEFSFKNTSEISAERWVRSYLKNKVGVDPFKINAYQDGDYQNDWVVAQALYLIEEEQENEQISEKVNEVVNEPVNVEKPNVEKKVDKVKNESKEEKTIYGVKVIKNVNQTCIWKVLKKVYENKDEEGTKIVKELKSQYPEVFENAVKCLVSKKRINYINSIVEA